MAEFPGAIDYFVDDSRVFKGQNDHSAIVIHGTGGAAGQTAQQLGDYFRSTPLETSTTYGIDRIGTIAQYVLEADGAGGNCCLEAGHDPFWDQFSDNKNLHTISIEHVNDSSNSLPLTDAQKSSSFKLIAYLCKKYRIPPENIKSHASMEPSSRALCPGPAYPWQELFDYLKGSRQQMPPNANQLKEAQDCWNSVFQMLGEKPPVTGTGIYQAWLSDWLTQGKQYGPPVTHEYDSNDWNGNHIVAQEFAHARCEWSGVANWYDSRGKI